MSTVWISIVRSVGHFLMLEGPEAVNQRIAGFVATTGAVNILFISVRGRMR